jgi:hypothetical protein
LLPDQARIPSAPRTLGGGFELLRVDRQCGANWVLLHETEPPSVVMLVIFSVVISSLVYPPFAFARPEAV